jgi:hypothetical protein
MRYKIGFQEKDAIITEYLGKNSGAEGVGEMEEIQESYGGNAAYMKKYDLDSFVSVFKELLDYEPKAVVGVAIEFNPKIGLDVTVETIAGPALEKLEEYGVRYEPDVIEYSLDQMMMSDLKQKMLAKEQKANMSNMTNLMTEDLLKRLADGQSHFVEMDNGNQKIKVFVKREVKIVDNTGQNTKTLQFK